MEKHQIKINEISFDILKLKALPLFQLTNLLLGSLEKLYPDDISVLAFKFILNNKMGLGIELNQEQKDLIENTRQALGNWANVVFDKLIVSNIDEQLLTQLTDKLLQYVRVNAGGGLLMLTKENIDLYISNVHVLYQLLLEILKYNYNGFF